ncbi:YihY/virulence factor BrkB family protein [Actinoallomurus purpureus]|uniref:YihY/virulence factor BrkB family protein n=1 Tax=Actinoallomurus purpureus TaxID=478114 RepID=UPI002092901F|nr:YhjD/YihY/BrkB family envelope integrity protein [Actinoallomurus purpureus]MCO6004718.1 YihY/virulence factor BrkB family protein [Actinoallomurus purpureus]
MIGGVQRGVTSVQEHGKAFLRGLRARWRWFDHMGRAYDRYERHRGNRLAAALTFYGFLSFFPLVALAFAVMGYAVAVSPGARDYVTKAISEILPGIADKLPVQQIADAKAGAGVFALLGLSWSGLGWIGVWREFLRTMWTGDPEDDANPILKKLADLAVLLVLGLTLLASVALSGLATSATHAVLHAAGVDHVPGAGTVLRLVAIGVAVVADTFVFLVLFSRLSGTRAPWRRLLRGCLFGALGFEALKLLGAYLVGHVVRNPLYASFAVIVGLLIWINVVSRFVLFTAAWTATRRVVLKADEATADAPPADDSEQSPRPAERT